MCHKEITIFGNHEKSTFSISDLNMESPLMTSVVAMTIYFLNSLPKSLSAAISP